jgi:endonuclease-3 related protein
VIRFGKLYDALFAAYGPQHWWPADDTFEIVAGAVLVQRTTWRNAEAALATLQSRGLLAPEALATADTAVIEACVRRAGFYRSKARRLQGVARFLATRCGFDTLEKLPTADLRHTLLALDGIGPETADAILLYAFERPAVVVDEYLRRLVRRLLKRDAAISDTVLRTSVAAEIDDVPRLNELHALVIAHGKTVCGRRPRCGECRLSDHCRTGSKVSKA